MRYAHQISYTPLHFMASFRGHLNLLDGTIVPDGTQKANFSTSWVQAHCAGSPQAHRFNKNLCPPFKSFMEKGSHGREAEMIPLICDRGKKKRARGCHNSLTVERKTKTWMVVHSSEVELLDFDTGYQKFFQMQTIYFFMEYLCISSYKSKRSLGIWVGYITK